MMIAPLRERVWYADAQYDGSEFAANGRTDSIAILALKRRRQYDPRKRSAHRGPSDRQAVSRPLVAAGDVGRGNCGKRLDDAVRSGALGAVFVQQPTVANSLRTARRQAL